MTDYNELNVEYVTYAQNVGAMISGYMPMPVLEARFGLDQALQRVSQDPSMHDWAASYFGTLHHLDAFLLSIERIVEQIDFLRNNILNPAPCAEYPKVIVKRSPHTEPPTFPPALIGISSKRIEIEAETTLLRAASLLERLNKLIGSELDIGVPRDNFGTLEGRLAAATNDACANSLLLCLAQAKPLFLKTLLADPATNTTNLRNTIAHRASSAEIMDKGFSINWLADGSLLAFDAELGEYPLVGTVRALARVVPYYAMESLRLLLVRLPQEHFGRQWAEAVTFQMGDFEPTWANPFIHYSSLIDPSDSGPMVSVFKWRPGGFLPHQRHLMPEVMGLAVRPTNVANP